MKIKQRKILRWSLFIFWITLIFIMSQQPGDISSEQSAIVIKIFSSIGIDLNGYFGNMGTFVVRKAAHFTEYLILFILTYRVLTLYMGKKVSKIYAVMFVFLYACSDEFHQSFVAGRGPAFRDVLIDTAGGIFSCLVVSIREKIKRNS